MSKPIDDPFLNITQFLAKDLKKVDQVIINNSQGKSELISTITNHLVMSGGKRVRPILAILSSKICGYKSGDRHCNLAAAVELIHTATLLHDDVVDDSLLRRGNETSNALWGNKASILVGDYLLSVAFQLMVKDGSLQILDILSNVSGVMSDGEVLQLMNKGDVEISQKIYLDIIYSKTAVLFASATQIGCLITDKSQYQQNLKDFGSNLGVVFQIMDDVLDYSSNNKALGKAIGDDFFEGKVTLPIIIAYNKANENERGRIKDIFIHNISSDKKDPNLLDEIMVLIEKYNALELSVNKALEYKILATQSLSIFEDCSEKEMLLSILEYCISRKL